MTGAVGQGAGWMPLTLQDNKSALINDSEGIPRCLSAASTALPLESSASPSTAPSGRSLPSESAAIEGASYSSAAPLASQECFFSGEQDADCAGDLRDVGRFEAAKQAIGLGQASPFTGALLLMNTLLGGTGMLGIPHAMATSGWLLGSGFMILFASFSVFGNHLLSCAARRVGTAPCSFYTVTSAVAPEWTWVIDAAVAVKCSGLLIFYLMLVGDLAPDPLMYFGLQAVPRQVCIVVAIGICGSLVCLRNLSALRHTAIVSMIIVVWTIVMFGLYQLAPTETFDPCSQDDWELDAGLEAKASCRNDPSSIQSIAVDGWLPIAKVLPVFIFGLTCQQNMFTVCNEVQQATPKRVDGIIITAYVVAVGAFLCAGRFAYFTFGSEVQPDVLLTYPRKAPVEATRLAFCFLVLFSFPLQAHPARTSILSLWRYSRGEEQQGVDRRFWIVTGTMISVAFVLAMTLKDLGKVIGLIGATGSTTVSYILPGALYVKAFPEPHFKRRLAMCQFLLGCVIMPFGVTVLFFL